MATLSLSLAPQTRVADAAAAAPRKNLRVVGLDTGISFSAHHYISTGRPLPNGRGPLKAQNPIESVWRESRMSQALQCAHAHQWASKGFYGRPSSDTTQRQDALGNEAAG